MLRNRVLPTAIIALVGAVVGSFVMMLYASTHFSNVAGPNNTPPAVSAAPLTGGSDQDRIVNAVKRAKPSVVAISITVNGKQFIPVDPFLQRYLGFLPLFSGPIYGIGLFTAGLLLALMIVPTVSAIARDLIKAVPTELREASIALGATRWETATRVVLPSARAGIVGACVLALGRALGETIAVTMVIGNRPAISGSIFAPAYTLSSVIANEFTEATSSIYLSALLELGLILFIVSVAVNGAARLLMWSMLRSHGRRP